MSIQEVWKDNPAQQALDKSAQDYAAIYLAAMKAATGLVDEINRAELAEAPSDALLEKEEEPQEERGDKGDLSDKEEEELEDGLLGFQDVMFVAAEIFKVMAQSLSLANAMAHVPQAVAQMSAPRSRRIHVKSEEEKEEAPS
jgi:hypothetical protein